MFYILMESPTFNGNPDILNVQKCFTRPSRRQSFLSRCGFCDSRVGSVAFSRSEIAGFCCCWSIPPRHKLDLELFHQPSRSIRKAGLVRRDRIMRPVLAKWPKFLWREEYCSNDVERRTGAYERRFPKKRPMSAPKIAVAMIAAPCAPSACHGAENGHAMRQPALIARPAPAPYRAPATLARVATEFRNTQLKNRTRIPPASVLPIPHAKPMFHGETRRRSLIHGGTGRGAVTGLVQKGSTE